ncbi:GNAT family N-acetyltransferase [Flavobacterium sp. HSC-61S13]|uniref:GNAT family N-acetyltransferase n=1 Tax=Flavobacterium sp. HSC-61S13 TaxID=2910963 RepID=UPI0020A06CE0|nr:GNAT family N-acetyltransferase [Flavobacterium sp. HSC-61S13]MCP1994670.1 ribosomal protein S18 acetylase RimI-like enzyme [Flavobacterium sp. HSC-61S13]
MIQINKKSPEHLPSENELQSYIAFLYQHLEQYGDEKVDIEKALNYALAKEDKPGGFILIAKKSTDAIAGIVVILDTKMDGFIPEHILVYIATDQLLRGQGIGKRLMEEAIKQTSGSIALHVEAQNPAKKLYEKLGFENKYLEMRLKK